MFLFVFFEKKTVFSICCYKRDLVCPGKQVLIKRWTIDQHGVCVKEPTVPRSDPPFDKLSFEKQSESYEEEGFQGNLGSLVDTSQVPMGP